MSIEENILHIRERIKQACLRSGRCPEDIRLVAVTKTVGVDSIMEAIKSGINIIGENWVQEIVEKYPKLDSDIEWHMIGHLQTNKIKYIVDKVQAIQSVDSIRLAGEIDKYYKKAGRKIDVFVEINIGGEQSKHGIEPDGLMVFLNEARVYDNINICGLMTVAPEYENAEMVRPFFRRMKELFEKARAENHRNINIRYLSMGMTNDFEIAIEEGANIVRVGRGIFGPRNYK
jgi:pyridoxal phosphate enzyme (YggS family)